MPVKRTALGRVKHEGCTYASKTAACLLHRDDERFEYVYKFLTLGRGTRPTGPPTRTCWMTVRCSSPLRRGRKVEAPLFMVSRSWRRTLATRPIS